MSTQVEPSPEAVEFVRFCYRRRRAGWPELYDEMCAVASRGLYLGWSLADLADHGIGFGLFDMPSLAALVGRVVAEEAEHRRSIGLAIPRRSGAGRSTPGAREAVEPEPRRALAGTPIAVG
ncbi:MAG TPA: hypothetical protein VIV06_11605 [Candidatus Limnocylindrales bacterium]